PDDHCHRQLKIDFNHDTLLCHASPPCYHHQQHQKSVKYSPEPLIPLVPPSD
ncbi:unnamed protein product, partial [Rotaria sp. Silwood2]